MNQAPGFSNVVWFFGIVEDNNDPLKLGRLRVRCFDIHSDDREKTRTEDLPWAMPIMPFNNSALGGKGLSPIGALNGTWVFGFFVDGEDSQHPMVLGTMPAFNTNLPNPLKGFHDPDGVYPENNNVYEPDTNRLARGENLVDTIVFLKNVLRKRSIKSSDGTVWDEPESPYNAEYPFNDVRETKSGHVVEYDDTPGFERIHYWHTSGTYSEIDSYGNKVNKISGDSFTIIEKNGKVFVDGKCDVTIAGNCNLYVMNNCNTTIDGNYNLNIHGNYNLNVGGKMDTNVQESSKTRAASLKLESYVDDLSLYSVGPMNFFSTGNMNIKSSAAILQQAATSYHVLSGSDILVSSGSSDVRVYGSQIHLNTSGTSPSSAAASTRTGLAAAIKKKTPLSRSRQDNPLPENILSKSESDNFEDSV